MSSSFYIKANRVFTPLRRYSWLFILLVAVGGLWFPKLGLLMLPVMLTLAVLGFFKGKYWCGNICPHGSLFDSVLIPFSANKKIPKFLKSKVLMVLAFSWFMYMLGRRLMVVFSTFGSAVFLDKLGYVFVINYLVVTIIGSLLVLFISPRAWCSFCPMGTFQVLSYKLGSLLGLNRKTDRKVTVCRAEKCHSCGKCSRVCPMQLTPYLEFDRDIQFSSESCIRCSTCVVNCPAGVLSLDNREEAEAAWQSTSIEGYQDRQKILARIESVNLLDEGINEYTFKFEDPPRVDYRAGQFILVKVQEEPPMFRAYSISSFNKDSRQLKITVKRMAGGYGTDIIFNRFKQGDLVELEGPMGRELLVDEKAERVLLVAGGIGITPFVPVVEDLLKKRPSVKEVKLIYGVNYEKEFLYDEYFQKMAYEYPKFEYIKITAFDEHWEGRKGFVTHVMEEMDLRGYKIYMCGPDPMIRSVLQLIERADIDRDNVYYESA